MKKEKIIEFIVIYIIQMFLILFVGFIDSLNLKHGLLIFCIPCIYSTMVCVKE